MSKKEADIPETGPEAIAYALSQVDLKELAEQAKKDIRSGKKTKQNRAVALLNIIQGMERNNQTPEDFMISKVPVIPAKYRPFAAQGGTFIPGDANILYKDLFDVKQAHEEEASMFGKENAGQSRLALYNAVKALYGYGDPVNPKTNAKEVGGFLKKLTGTTAKYSFVNSKMMAKTQDNVGRSTIIVDPELDIDEIGIPKGMAFKMYAPYVQRELKMAGYGDVDALQAVKDQNEPALKALEKAADARPVIFSRAPAWHGFSVLGGKVKLTDGKAISINPYVTTGLNADFDGDTINVHVPSTDAAVKEVKEKFMPSATPFSNREARKVVPNLKQEQILGLYTAATAPKKDPVVFSTEEEAINAIRRGEVPLDADVEVNGKDYSQYGQQKEASGKEDRMTVEQLFDGMSDEDKHLLGADFKPKVEKLRKALEADDGSVVFSTDADGKTRAFRWDDGDTMEMAYVRPEDRGKGFGRKLVHQSAATKTKVKRKNEAMKHILGARWKFDDLNGDHEDWVRKERTDAEVEAERKFNEVLDTFKGMGLKPGRKLQLVYTDSPDVYEDGSPVLDPELVNATELVDSSTSGGSQTKHGKIYINSDMGRVMEHHGVKDMSPDDFTYHMMGHELAHEFDANVITEEQREKLLKAMEDEGYHSRYADSYDKEKSPHKWKKEAVAEYLSHLNATRRKEADEEKQAAFVRAALEEAGVDPTEDTVMFANMINKASGFQLIKMSAGRKGKKFVMLKGCKQENGGDGPCVKSTHFSAYLPDKDVAEAAIRVAKSGKKEWLCRLVSKYCGVRRTCGEDWKIVDFKSMEE